LYNIAQALVLLGRYTEAVATFERYLEQGGANVEQQRRTEVESSISRAREHTGTIELSIDTDGALVSIDDKPAGRSPLPAPIRVDAGAHRLRAVFDSGVERAQN